MIQIDPVMLAMKKLERLLQLYEADMKYIKRELNEIKELMQQWDMQQNE